MPRISNSEAQASALGALLLKHRKRKGLTLQRVKDAIEVDVGQLSRFERGDFRFESTNLQKYADFLQVSLNRSSHAQDALSRRFLAVLQRSARHEQAARALVHALENLQ